MPYGRILIPGCLTLTSNYMVYKLFVLVIRLQRQATLISNIIHNIYNFGISDRSKSAHVAIKGQYISEVSQTLT